MAKWGILTYAQRMRLKSSQFAESTLRKYPIENEAHARNALARVSEYGTNYERMIVCKAVAKKYPKIHEQSCSLNGRKYIVR